MTQVFVVGEPAKYVVLGMDGPEQVEKEEMLVDQDASAQEKGKAQRREELRRISGEKEAVRRQFEDLERKERAWRSTSRARTCTMNCRQNGWHKRELKAQ